MRALLLGLALTTVGCHPTVTFDVKEQGTGTIMGSPLGGVLGALPGFTGLTNLDFSQSQEFQNQGVTKQDVDSVKMKSFTLQLQSPNDENYAWLQSLQFFAQTGSQQDLVASKSNIPQLGLAAPNPTLNLDVTGVELKPYVTAPSMNITANGTGQPPPKDTTLLATVVITVVANVVH